MRKVQTDANGRPWLDAFGIALCPRAVSFLTELDELCRKHNITISHEDYQGSFELIPYDEKLQRSVLAPNDTALIK